MNGLWFDAIVLTLVLILGLKGLFSGLIKEVAGLVGLVGGFFVATRTASKAADLINVIIPNIENQDLVYTFGFVGILVIVWVCAFIAGLLISKILKLSSLGFLDRIGGFLFGASKVFLILAIAFACLNSINFIKNYLKPLEEKSIVYNVLDSIGNKLIHTNAFSKVTSQTQQIVQEKIEKAD